MRRLSAWGPVVLACWGAAAHHRALRNYQGLPALQERPLADTPMVSIVVPARDEAVTLPGLLSDLLALRYPHYEVLVVDDQSSDGTASLARAAGVRVVAAPDPPVGCTGKANACQAGAAVAVGDWLLFADADTRHASGSLAAAMGEVQRRGLAALSILPDQECRSIWEQLIIPFLYASYFAAVDPATTNRSAAEALLNGQYLLIRRDAYDAIGGHAAVATSLVEDVALAVRLRRLGYPIGVVRGAGLVQVRMYRDRASVTEGFRKNSFGFLRLQPRRGVVVALATVGAAAPTPVLIAAARGRSRLQMAVSLVALAMAMTAFGRWVRACGADVRLGMLQPVAATASLVVVVQSTMAYLLRRPLAWKGRWYHSR